MMEGKRILILGSGPSAAELQSIPGDVKIFTCNRGLKFFDDRPRPKIGLYLCTKSKIERLGAIEASLKRSKIEILAIDDPGYLQKRPALNNGAEVLFDDGMDDVYLQPLLAPRRPAEIRGRSKHAWTSTGLRLLQYALIFNAREIYLAGIDFGQNGYFWGQNQEPWTHRDIDENFLEIMSKKHDNIFSMSPNSLASKHLKVKNL